MSFLLQTIIGVAQLVAGFYGFWLVWRVLLPILPGPSDPKDRIAPFDRYFTIYVMRKQKFYDNDWMDAAWNVDAALGNFFTNGQAAVEFRFGDRPGGFAPTFTPIGRNLDYDARIQLSGESYFYASMIVRATGLLFALPRHGNLLRNGNEWTENERIDPENLLGRLVLGLHYERANWGLHFTFNLATDAVGRESGPDLKDPSNNFGILVGEWKY